ncbi:MAG: HlyD family type I secretion membrane fusion protein [Rickettsiales bacterium]|jgi:HlyD family type I secretion membrane fusion protein
MEFYQKLTIKIKNRFNLALQTKFGSKLKNNLSFFTPAQKVEVEPMIPDVSGSSLGQMQINPEDKLTSPAIKQSVNYGVKSLIIFAAIFLTWAIFMPIQSASIAEGKIVLDFNRKTIQHLEGGIIDQILIKEGQTVQNGDILLYLHDIKAKTEQQILQERLWAMQLQKERLLAENENKSVINLDDFFSKNGELSESDSAKLEEITNNQIRLFEARKAKRLGEIRVLEKKFKSSQTRLKIFRKELSLIKPLVKEGNLPILRELELEKSIVELDAETEVNRLQIANYTNEDLGTALKEIKETDMEIVGLFNQLSASKDILKRSAIVSPVRGKVMDIKYHTIGAVVPAGGEILSIVPTNEELIIEAKVRPQDIDNIAIGMEAKVALTAFTGNKVPKMNGKVLNISADIITDEQSQESYFLARVKIDQKEIDNLKAEIELYPGMPAQVFIVGGGRTLVSYLLTPLSDSAYRAFREE